MMGEMEIERGERGQIRMRYKRVHTETNASRTVNKSDAICIRGALERCRLPRK